MSMKTLPLFKVKGSLVNVPKGSIVLVCHTVQRYDLEKISLGIQWVAVLATTDDNATVVRDIEHDPARELSPE